MRWAVVLALAAALQYHADSTAPAERSGLLARPVFLQSEHFQEPSVAFSLARARASRAQSIYEAGLRMLKSRTTWIVLAALGAVICLGCVWRCWPRASSAAEVDDVEKLAAEERDLEEKLRALREQRSSLEDERYEKEHPHAAQGNLRGLNEAIDRFVERRLTTALDKVRTALARKEEAQRVLVHRYEVETKRTMDSLKKSAEGFMDDVRGLADIQDHELGKGHDIPPVAMVLAGIVAPAQLFSLVVVNRVMLFWHVCLVGFDAFVLIWSYSAWADFDPHCPGVVGAVVTLKHQILWVGIHCGLHIVMLLIRVWVEWTVRRTFARITNREAPPHHWAGHFSVFLQSDIDNPRALYLYDYISSSRVFQFASVLLVADFALNITGVATFVTDRARCPDGFAVRIAMQMYGTLFVLFFLFNVIFVVLLIAYQVAARPGHIATLLRKARDFDATYMPTGLPLVTLFLRVFVFRNVADRQHVEDQCLQHEAAAVEAEEAKLLQQVEALRAEKASIAQARQKLGKAGQETNASEEQFAQKWLHDLETTFEDDGTGPRMSEMFATVRADVQAAVAQAKDSEAYRQARAGLEKVLHSDAAQKALEQAKAAYAQAQAQAQGALSSEAGQAALAQAKAALEHAEQGLDKALRSQAAQDAMARAQEAYQQAQEQAKGALESEHAQAAVARAKQAYEQAQEQVKQALDSEEVHLTQAQVGAAGEAAMSAVKLAKQRTRGSG